MQPPAKLFARAPAGTAPTSSAAPAQPELTRAWPRLCCTFLAVRRCCVGPLAGFNGRTAVCSWCCRVVVARYQYPAAGTRPQMGDGLPWRGVCRLKRGLVVRVGATLSRDGPARHAVPRIHVRRHRPSRAQLLAGLAALDARSTRSRELAAITPCAYLGAACWLRHRGSSENLLVRHRTSRAATRAVSRKSIGTEQRVVTEVRLGALRSPDRPRRTR